jgi:hypothetical protein
MPTAVYAITAVKPDFEILHGNTMYIRYIGVQPITLSPCPKYQTRRSNNLTADVTKQHAKDYSMCEVELGLKLYLSKDLYIGRTALSGCGSAFNVFAKETDGVIDKITIQNVNCEELIAIYPNMIIAAVCGSKGSYTHFEKFSPGIFEEKIKELSERAISSITCELPYKFYDNELEGIIEKLKTHLSVRGALSTTTASTTTASTATATAPDQNRMMKEMKVIPFDELVNDSQKPAVIQSMEQELEKTLSRVHKSLDKIETRLANSAAPSTQPCAETRNEKENEVLWTAEMALEIASKASEENAEWMHIPTAALSPTVNDEIFKRYPLAIRNISSFTLENVKLAMKYAAAQNKRHPVLDSIVERVMSIEQGIDPPGCGAKNPRATLKSIIKFVASEYKWYFLRHEISWTPLGIEATRAIVVADPQILKTLSDKRIKELGIKVTFE